MKHQSGIIPEHQSTYVVPQYIKYNNTKRQHVYGNSTEHINIMLLRKITTTLQHYNNTDQHRIQYIGNIEYHNTTTQLHITSGAIQISSNTAQNISIWDEQKRKMYTHINAAHSITEWACITTAHRCTAQNNRAIALQSRRIQELPHIPTLYIMLASTQLTLSYFLSIRNVINEPTFRLEDSLLIGPRGGLISCKNS